jgi:hypothetical protein
LVLLTSSIFIPSISISISFPLVCVLECLMYFVYFDLLLVHISLPPALSSGMCLLRPV